MENPRTTPRPVLKARWASNGRVVTTDLQTLGPMLAYYRTRLGLTRGALATQSLTTTGVTLAAVETGRRGISSRSLALRLAHALKLTPREIDHFLQVAGYAPVLDWQQLCENIVAELGLESVLDARADALYTTLSTAEARRARVPVRRAAHG